MKMKSNNTNRAPRRRAGFTLIEMIGVLAVIAILAALLIPRVFSAINDSRINGACVSCETVKTAVADHYGKYGRFDTLFGTNNLTFASDMVSAYDKNVLMVEGLLDKPFSAKVAGGDPATNSIVQLVRQPGTPGAIGNGGLGYKLDGVNIGTSTNSSYVIEAVLYNVAAADAKDLSDRLDGQSLGAAPGAADTLGRVEYAAPVNGQTTVYVYLTHR